MERIMYAEHTTSISDRLNWRVSEFCDAYHMGRTKFYYLVKQGKIRIVKCGNTSLVTDTERQRFHQAMEAGEV
jgi:hypothetical protein